MFVSWRFERDSFSPLQSLRFGRLAIQGAHGSAGSVLQVETLSKVCWGVSVKSKRATVKPKNGMLLEDLVASLEMFKVKMSRIEKISV